MDENLKGAPEAVTSICALIVGSLAARVKRMKGAGYQNSQTLPYPTRLRH